jgi:hypothetical protein
MIKTSSERAEQSLRPGLAGVAAPDCNRRGTAQYGAPMLTFWHSICCLCSAEESHPMNHPSQPQRQIPAPAGRTSDAAAV